MHQYIPASESLTLTLLAHSIPHPPPQSPPPPPLPFRSPHPKEKKKKATHFNELYPQLRHRLPGRYREILQQRWVPNIGTKRITVDIREPFTTPPQD